MPGPRLATPIPEGSANTLGHDAVVMSGQSKGVIMGHSDSTVEGIAEMFTENNTYGGTFDAVEIATSDMSTNTLTYGVAYTSENVAAAAEMMSLIWTDEFIASSLIYGWRTMSATCGMRTRPSSSTPRAWI